MSYPPYPPQDPNQQPYGYGYPAVPQVKTNALATAALVCGLVALLFMFAIDWTGSEHGSAAQPISSYFAAA